MLHRLTRALRGEAERWTGTESDLPAEIMRSFALSSDLNAEPHLDGFQIRVPDLARRGRVFTVIVIEEQGR